MWPTKKSYCPVKLKYLVDNGYEYGHDSTDRAYNVLDVCCKLRDLSALECLVGKYSRFNNSLLRELLSNYYSYQEHIPNQVKPWINGIKYVFKRGKEIKYISIESVFVILQNMEIVKYLRESLTSNDRNKYILLSKIAHYHGFDAVKWALYDGLCHDNPCTNSYIHKCDDTIDVCNLIIERGFTFSSSLEKREVIENALHSKDCNALLQKIPVPSVKVNKK